MIPDHTAVRVALWRALHLLVDEKPYVFQDDFGPRLANEPGWRDRPDMKPDFSKPMRASIVGRARFIEDLVEEHCSHGVTQYVILGAGLDSFAQRRTDLASKLTVFEVDQSGTQAWKKSRFAELNILTPPHLRYVPVDFEAGESWLEKLGANGFDPLKPSIIVSTGVSMYLSREANEQTFQKIASLAPGTVFASTFMLALELLEPQERGIMEFVMKKAAESGTPFVSLFRPEDITWLAKSCGFKTAEYIPASEIYKRYFTTRTDGLRAGQAEAFVVATV